MITKNRVDFREEMRESIRRSVENAERKLGDYRGYVDNVSNGNVSDNEIVESAKGIEVCVNAIVALKRAEDDVVLHKPVDLGIITLDEQRAYAERLEEIRAQTREQDERYHNLFRRVA